MMERLLAIFDRLWRGWTFLGTALTLAAVGFIVFACVSHARQDREFVRASVLPVARYVEGFRDARGRLPTDEEFRAWAAQARGGERLEYYPQKPGFVADWGVPGRDFVVGCWRGQWMHYYRSWDGRDFAGEFTGPVEAPRPH